MHKRPSVGDYTFGYVVHRFELAGRTLMALPLSGCYPAGIVALWPEMSFGSERRWDTPSNADISLMTECYQEWMRLAYDEDADRLIQIRRLIGARSLVIPDSAADDPKFVVSWRSLARQFQLDKTTLATRWARGIDTIVTRLNRPGYTVRSGGRLAPSMTAADRLFRRRAAA